MKYHSRWLGTIVLSFLICFLIQQYWTTGSGLVQKIWLASQPFVIGATIAYVINLVMRVYESLFEKLLPLDQINFPKRGLSLVLAYASFIVLIFWLFSILIPDLIASINSLMKIDTKVFQVWLSDLYKNPYVAELLDRVGIESDLPATLSRYSQQILNQVVILLTGLLTSVTGIASTILNVFVSLVFSIYVLSSKEQLIRQFSLLIDSFTGRLAPRIHYILDIVNQRFSGFLVSQTLEAIILGTLTFIGMLMFKFPYAGTVGVLVSFTALIPVVGGFIGTGIGFILIATTSFEQAVWFVVYMVVLQQLEGNLIYPRVVGGSIGLPGIWVLMAITVGGAIGGLVGMLCAVPITASLYQMIKDLVVKRQINK